MTEQHGIQVAVDGLVTLLSHDLDGDPDALSTLPADERTRVAARTTPALTTLAESDEQEDPPA